MDIRRKKLVYRANYRGFKEAELILGGFAKKYVDNFTEDELTIFEDLLTAKDHDIYDWITGKTRSGQLRHAAIYAYSGF